MENNHHAGDTNAHTNGHSAPPDPPRFIFSRLDTNLPSGELTAAQEQRLRHRQPTDPNTPLAVAVAGILFGLLGLGSLFTPCLFVATAIGGIMGLNALATRKSGDYPGMVALIASLALLLVAVDVAVLAFHFNRSLG